MDDHFFLIKYHYASGNSLALFQTILEVAREVGMEQALALLEACVIEKHLFKLTGIES